MHRQMGFGAAALACTLAWFAAGCGADAEKEPTVTAFESRTITTDNCHTVIDDYDPNNGTQYAGDDRGGIALTASGLIYNGDIAAVSYDKVALTEPPKILPMRDGLVEDLQTRDIYSLGLADGTLLDRNTYQGPWDSLWLLDEHLAKTSRHIPLSQPISFGPGNSGKRGIFAGYGHVLFWDGAHPAPSDQHFWKVDLTSGQVTDLPYAIGPQAPIACENWAYWGWTETFGGHDYITYAANAFGGTLIVRIDLSGISSPPFAFLHLLPQSDMCSIVPDPEDGRWYFHYESGDPGLPGYNNNNGEIVGYCDATFSYGKSL